MATRSPSKLVLSNSNSDQLTLVNYRNFTKNTNSDRLRFEKKTLPKMFLNKRQVLSSKQICTKCKECLLKQKTRFFAIYPKMFKPQVNATNLNCSARVAKAFDSLFTSERLPVQTDFLRVSPPAGIKWNKAELCKKLCRLKNLNYILIKLFAGKAITKNNLKFVSTLERSILEMILQKKQLAGPGQFALTEAYFAKLSRTRHSKRFEENLRYLTNKTFRFLTTCFKSRIFEVLSKSLHSDLRGRSLQAQQAYAFFGYYFEEYCSSPKKPVECFFHPNTRRIRDLRFAGLVPKTVSQQYLRTLRVSDSFVNDFLYYLDRRIHQDAEADIVKKTRKLCLSWEAELVKTDPDSLVAAVRSQLWKNPKFKLPWTLDEVKMAVDQIKNILSPRAPNFSDH